MTTRNLNRLLSKAIRIASQAHEEQLDKGNSPYILHPMRIMFRLRTDDPELNMIAMLHDVMEDTQWTLDDFINEGFTDRVLNALRLLTHNKDHVAYEDYIENMCDNLDAVKVKMGDLKDNSDITRLKGVTDKDIERMKKYHKSYLRLDEAKEKLEG
ncbi:hypothetical protein PBI_SCTP2_487 [Salicola phage SCTP-2]|nr:hypothetical protein PBI_SCTP2_487 [Salicola phage SCTP-2]